MIRKSHPIMDLNLAEDMYSFMLTYTDKSKIAFEQYGTDAVSYINCRQRLPFIIVEGKIRWDVPLKEVTLHEFVDTFYSNYGEKTEIEFLEVEQCYEEDDYETENKAFYKYLKATVKKWRPRKRKISIRELKRFTEQNEMPVRYILRAIWLKKSYSLSEFCTLFSVEKAEASKILNAAGYLKKDTDVDYYIMPHFRSDIQDCLEKAKLAYRELGRFVSIKNRVIRDFHRGIYEVADNVSANVKSKDFFVHPLSSWDEPAYAKRSDWRELLISGLIVIVMLLTIVLGIVVFYYQMKNDALKYTDTIYGFWSSIIAAFIGGLVTIGTTFFIIKRSYKLDYHQERMSVMPVFAMTLERENFYMPGCNILEGELKDLVSDGECYFVGSEMDAAMLLKLRNIGKGVAFRVEVEGLTPYYEDPKFQSVSSDERKNMILYHNDGFECTIKYYDIYGNYYFQKFFASRRDMGGRVYISSFPPELVLRTKRMRYTQ